ncbi:MAG: collagen-like protein [Chlorobi bacterium]|nr:collagen-like protein [Chlorobiota bacterium]
MKTTQKLMYVIMIAVIAAFASCKGETGPAGPAGADGTDGINGTDGTNGQDGNANVIASSWISPTWSATNATYGYFSYADAAITKDFLSTGVILSYMDWYGDTTNIYSVPYSYYQAGNFISFDDNLLVGSIKWFFSTSVNYTPNTGSKFRYVLIPASTTSKSANPQQEILYNLDKVGVDVNNYYQVMDYYGLKY